jgi:hypothetical protein
MITHRVASLPKWKESCRGFMFFYWMAVGSTICFPPFKNHLALSLLFGLYPFLPQDYSKLVKMEERARVAVLKGRA